MTPTEKALWYIESHFAQEIALDDVAESAGVSRFHLSRAFGLATGQSLTGYLRGRRLTVAARVLADGAPDILSVALDAGYGSHEAFTRAFREQFGVTPEAVRAQRSVSNLPLCEAFKMNQAPFTALPEPRFEKSRAMTVAGLCESYDQSTIGNIPAQWQRLMPYLGHISGQSGNDAYGVIRNPNADGKIDYIAGVEVSNTADLPKEFEAVRIPAQQTYAVFACSDHISSIQGVFNAIWSRWLPESGREVASAPEFERYGQEFDPRTGNGGFEIWIPLKD